MIKANMEDKKYIQSFVKSVCEKEYSKASVDLQKIVSEKIKARVEQALKNSK